MLRIAKSLLTIVAVAVIAVGATGAYFSSTVTSTGNSFSSGTLKIMLSELHPSHNIITEVFQMANMMPGVESPLIRQGIALEAGSMQPNHLEFRVTTHDFVDPVGDSTADDFKKAIILTDFSLNGGPDWTQYGFNKHLYRGLDGDASSFSLYDAEAAGIFDDVPLTTPTREFRMQYKLSEAAGNEFQGDSIEIDFEIGAAQVAGQSVLP